MSDKENTAIPTDTPDTESATKSDCPSCAGKGCSHLPLIVAFIALLLAAFAVISNQGNVSSGTLDSRLQQLDEKLADINQRIDSMETDVASNRENLVKNQLKKLLINIQEISSIAAEETRDQLAQVTSLLQEITQPATDEPGTPEVTPEAEQEVTPADNGTATPTDNGAGDSSDIPSVELQMPDSSDSATPAEALPGDNAL